MRVPEHEAFEVAINPYRKPGELSLIFCGYGRPVGGHKQGPAVHDYYLVHTVRSGSGKFVFRGHQYKCKAGDSFVIFPGELFYYEADAKDPWAYMWVAFAGTLAGELLQTVGVSPLSPVVRGVGKSAYARYHRIRKTLQDADSPALADLECAGHLRLLLGDFGEANKARIMGSESVLSEAERHVEYAANFLRTQFAQQISIGQLADKLGYHRTYFTWLFKRHKGCSPKQYLYGVRMEQAGHLLATTALPVEQIAASVGYLDSLYFSKHFRRWSGMAPTAYRKKEFRPS